MSEKICAHGTKFGYGSPCVDVAEVQDINGPGMSRNVADVTSHDSLGFTSKLSCLADAGEITFPIVFDPVEATHDAATGLLSLWASGDLEDFCLTFTDVGGTEWQFAGFVTGFVPKAPVAGNLSADVTVTITDDINFTP